MSIPSELKYTKDHEWLRIEGDRGTVGITDYAQGELGDIVFVELPEKGRKVEAGKSFGTIEAVKAVSDLYAPVSGEIVEVNGSLREKPELINKEPYAGGWMVRIKIAKPAEASALLDAAAYTALIGK
jgi:glycine cleavage system H protein